MDYHIFLAWWFFTSGNGETMTLRSETVALVNRWPWTRSHGVAPGRRDGGPSGRVPLSPSVAALNALIAARIASQIVNRGSPRRPCTNPVSNSPICLRPQDDSHLYCFGTWGERMS